MGIYIIGIGGTGSKCIEAITNLAATGIYTDEPIKVMFVDADETNGSLERARNNLSLYNKISPLMAGSNTTECPWFKTKIEYLGLWSPFGQENALNKNLNSFFQYDNITQEKPALANLFDVLYTKEEQKADLDVGFRGRPAIGSAVMSQVDLDKLDQEPWGTLIRQVQMDVGGGQQTKIFLCGSIFGGTGASGLATIGRIIANKLEKINLANKVKISCLLMLPYFNFSVPVGEDPNGVYAKAEEFLLNTEAALRYYNSQAKNVFNIYYILGNQNLSQVKRFSIGKNTQRNEAHFLEIYAGLAARHFLLNTLSDELQVGLIAGQAPDSLTWNDISDQAEVKPRLANTTRFAYAWLAIIANELKRAQQIGFDNCISGAPWLRDFYSSRQQNLPNFSDSQQQTAIEKINQWCKTYLTWLVEIHQNDVNRIELFRVNAFRNLDAPLAPAELKNLLFEDIRDENAKRKQDEPANILKKLNPQRLSEPNRGTIGLAKSLYKTVSI